jgi:colicin import membrane protein
MRAPSIKKTAAVSSLLHLAFLVLSVFLINYSKTVVTPSPYTVSLVNPANTRSAGPPVSKSPGPASPAAEKEKAVKEKPVKESVKMPEASTKNNEKRLDDRLTELASKKKVERIVKLRSVISVQSSGIKSPVGPAGSRKAVGDSKGSLFDSYYGKITEEIRGEWIYPDMGKKDLEAIVSVLIRRDGTITVQGVEKSSGDLLFDRSALKAVTKASPVSPPPYEMEIGIRFYP